MQIHSSQVVSYAFDNLNPDSTLYWFMVMVQALWCSWNNEDMTNYPASFLTRLLIYCCTALNGGSNKGVL